MMDDRLRVLVVDDEDMVRATLVDMLGLAGYEVCGEAVDGIQALEAVGRLHPDIVMMDICMPRMDGIQAARVIRSTWNIPIIFLTAFLDREMVNRAADAGAFAYLIKPCRQAELAPAIEMALKRFGETRSHHERAEASQWELQAVRTLAEEIARGAGIREVLQLALRYIVRGLDVPAAALMVREGGDLRISTAVGLDAGCREHFRRTLEDPLFGRAVLSNHPQTAVAAEEDLLGPSGNAFGPCRSALAVPVPVGAAPAGCLVACRPDPVAFTREETVLVSTMASEVGIAIQALQRQSPTGWQEALWS
ncbi:MAG TPA: response regulator [Armatimonadetes bacterium]|jgi:AmiR/NasT family two-component response regulator|nr:response regulator [Armatimonadota bacterium]